jgi:hypothetical protein
MTTRYKEATSMPTATPPSICDVHVESFDEEILFYLSDEESIFNIKEPPAYLSVKGVTPKGFGRATTLTSLPLSQVTERTCSKSSVNAKPTPSASHGNLGRFFCNSVVFPFNGCA